MFQRLCDHTQFETYEAIVTCTVQMIRDGMDALTVLSWSAWNMIDLAIYNVLY